jgi:hypothetical protein
MTLLSLSHPGGKKDTIISFWDIVSVLFFRRKVPKEASLGKILADCALAPGMN